MVLFLIILAFINKLFIQQILRAHHSMFQALSQELWWWAWLLGDGSHLAKLLKILTLLQ